MNRTMRATSSQRAKKKATEKKSIHDDEEKKGAKHALEVSSKASTNTRLLCRGVDAYENEVRLLDGAVYLRGEIQVATTCFFDNIDEAWFIYGKGVVGAVPSVDSFLVEVNDGDLNVGAFQRNDSASRATL